MNPEQLRCPNCGYGGLVPVQHPTPWERQDVVAYLACGAARCGTLFEVRDDGSIWELI